jgi:hypothetical protein
VKKKRKDSELEDGMRPEYDLSRMKIVGRGIYRERYRSGTNLVLLEADVRKTFGRIQELSCASENLAGFRYEVGIHQDS